jgi:predicted O-linked N-acetylglucosamine transferase (SPINDLY family)
MNYSEDTQTLVDAMKDGRMSQMDLLAHVEHLETLGEHRAAANMYALWINHAQAPDKHFALFNYGGLLQNLQRPEEAQVAYETCIALRPEFPQPYINLGLLHEKRGQETLALQAWLRLINRRYLDQPPNDEFLTMALNHIGRLQENLKNYDQAEEALEQSLLINPVQPGVIQHWVHIRQKACKWPVYKPLAGVEMADMRRYTSPLAMLALSDDPAEQLLAAQSFVSRTYEFKEEWLYGTYQHERLRIGYVSGDFREHAVGFLLPAMLAGHDKNEYELYGYDFSKDEQTAVRQQIRSHFDHFKSIHHLTDRAAAELIRMDQIDILIDLHGLSNGARPGIFALHPAPRQGTYLGFIGSTGMPWLDFVVADPVVLPEELTPYFSEKPLYLDGSFLPRVSYAAKDSQLSRSQFGIPQGAFAMGALGNTYKITPEMFEVWMRLLKRIPESVLCLIDDNKAGTSSLRAQAVKHGVSQDQLIFLPRTPHANFCGLLALMDVYLDTYPYNCGSTTNDVIHAGVPLVTMHGKTMVSRMGLSVLTSLGMAQNATRSFAGYEDRVVEVSLKKKAGQLATVTLPSVSLPMGQALKDLNSPKRQEREPSLALQQMSNPRVEVFQICYSPETLAEVPAGFGVLNNLDNPRPDWREFWPIRQYLLSHELEEDVFYGFFSPRFNYKTALTMETIHNQVYAYGKQNDVLIFSPNWDLSAFFANPFIQSEFFYPGFMGYTQIFVDSVRKEMNLKKLVMHKDNTVFNNFFIAKKDFWLGWLELGDKILVGEKKNENLIFKELNDNSIKNNFFAQKIDVQDQITNILLSNSKFKSKSLSVSNIASLVNDMDSYKSQAIIANALKFAYTKTKEYAYLKEFHQLSEEVIKKIYQKDYCQFEGLK